MSRVIKFRAWDPVDKRLYESWSNGSLIGFAFLKMIGAAVDDRLEDNMPTFDFMQYTGLKDKNGVEIYEGDIVVRYDKNERGYLYRKSNTVRVIEWRSSFNETGFNIGSSSHLEVIGNIYEHGHLLENESKE